MTTGTDAESAVERYLGDRVDDLLRFDNPRISRDRLHLPGPDFVDRVFGISDRNPRVLASLQRLFDHGRLRGTGYLSILPVDQGIEHSAGASFARNPDYPIDLCRYQVANGYMGRAGLINSGGASGDNDFADAVATAVINKRAGGMGLISGRKAFQRPMDEGVRLLHAIQDVYLSPAITIA
jgi:DhnA family fructose-bisphosphate aldolase class Ia